MKSLTEKSPLHPHLHKKVFYSFKPTRAEFADDELYLIVYGSTTRPPQIEKRDAHPTMDTSTLTTFLAFLAVFGALNFIFSRSASIVFLTWTLFWKEINRSYSSIFCFLWASSLLMYSSYLSESICSIRSKSLFFKPPYSGRAVLHFHYCWFLFFDFFTLSLICYYLACWLYWYLINCLSFF